MIEADLRQPVLAKRSGIDAHDGLASVLSGDVDLQAVLAETVSELMRRAQAAGKLRPDAMIDDIPMLMCGVGMGQRKAHTCSESWRRHLAIVIDGLRASSASGPLPV